MGQSLRETIAECTQDHLDAGGIVAGMNLQAVGRVAGTLPESIVGHPNVWEMPGSDAAWPGFCVGAALSGKPVMMVIRYQGFLWLNAWMVANYAAKCFDMWGYRMPLLVRALVNEGQIGPVAGSAHHGMIAGMPGIRVCAPMLPCEWGAIYRGWVENPQPLFVSEHRKSYDLTDAKEFFGAGGAKPDVVLFPIGGARIAVAGAIPLLADADITVACYPIRFLSPLMLDPGALEAAQAAQFSVVIDSDYPQFADAVAGAISVQSRGKQVHSMGLKWRAAGFGKHDNTTPMAEEIVAQVKEWFGT